MERIDKALQEHFGADQSLKSTALITLQSSRTNPPHLRPNLSGWTDKITILQIKTKHLLGTSLENVKKELDSLESILDNLQLNIDPTLIQRLKEVNKDLWQIEDDIRDQELQKNFGETFIHLARAVYQQNDQRAAIKREINTTYGSTFIEEKSYKKYWSIIYYLYS